jgi:putative CocE/NonD family hydrolase
MYDLKCPMRDGSELSTDVYLPADGGPYPALLLRTPYDNIAEGDIERIGHIYWAQRGYILVTQDARGRYDSPGEWYPFINEAHDGQDAIEWVARQPWCNGKVGIVGSSYRGLTQWQAAQGGSPNLLAAVPKVAYSNLYHNWVYTGGAFQLAFGLSWAIAMATNTMQWQYFSLPEELHLRTLLRHLPLATSDEAMGRTIPFWKDWVNHPTYDDYWRSLKPVGEHYPEIDVPAFAMAGWFDVFLQGSLNNFMGMTAHGKTERARRGQKIVVGPWIHNLGAIGTEKKTGDIDFTDEVLIDLRGEENRWFDYWLKGIDNGIVDEPRVKVFVMGANRWRESDDWPLPETVYTPYYIHSRGNANALFGDGALDTSPQEQEPPDQYVYDPEHPVATIGGSTCCSEATVPVTMGPRDQRPNEYRPDVLVYTSPTLEHDVEVTGPVKATLYASSSARDTDFTAKLVDVFPNGYAMNVAQGIIRARYRDSWERPELLEPGKVYRFDIDLWSTGNCFQTGHRIRLEIASSNFPQFDRNPNTGHPFGQDAEVLKAQQTVYHDREHQSHILLPVIP